MPVTLPPNGELQCPEKFKPQSQLQPHTVPKLSTLLAIDTETTGLNHWKPYPGFLSSARPFAVSMCDGTGTTWLFKGDVNPVTRDVNWQYSDLAKIREIISSYQFYVFHNANFDIRMLKKLGVLLHHRRYRIHDTSLASHVLNSKELHGLKPLALKYGKFPTDDEAILKEATIQARREAKKLGIPTAPDVAADYWLPEYIHENYGIRITDVALETYAVNDAVRTILLWKIFQPQLTKQKLWRHYSRELYVLPILYNMESHGIYVKKKTMQLEKNRYTNLCCEARETVEAAAASFHMPDFNINSSNQLATLFFQRMRLPILYTTPTGAPSTTKDTFIELQGITERKVNTTKNSTKTHWQKCNVTVAQYLEYKSYKTALTYVEGYHARLVPIPHTKNWSALHPGYHCNGTATTRLASHNPNGQNIGKRDEKRPLRALFGPPYGKLWYALDFDQLEIRIMATASQDATLLHILETGGDMHQITADALGIPRSGQIQSGKHINFAWQYGAGIDKLSVMAGMPAADFDLRMRKTYPGVLTFMDRTIALAKKYGYVETLFGYKLKVPWDMSYIGINYIVQGTAGDLCKNAMIAMNRYISSENIHPQIQLVLNVHDELVYECSKDIPKTHLTNLSRIMAASGDVIGCPTPVHVERTDTNWAAVHPARLPANTTAMSRYIR